MTDFPPRFLICLPFTLAQEAPFPSQWGNPRNFSNDPGDPGGRTMDGVIQSEYTLWRTSHGLLTQDVSLISEAEGDDIYLTCYWLPWCPKLAPGLDMEFFDAAVNEGVGEAIKILQYALHVANDGQWGDQTDAAVAAITDVTSVINDFAARREAVYEESRGFTRFGADWTRRTSEIKTAALGMVGSPPTVTATFNPDQPSLFSRIEVKL